MIRSGGLMAVVVTSAVLVLAACSDHEFEPPDLRARVEEAAARFDVAVFDSITWATDEIRATQGNEVYAAKCRRCHGTLGMGNTEYARGRGLEPPSLVEPEWRFASLDSLRRMVFVGHEDGMPIYGVGGISLREIDAASFYVLFQLRPDVLGDDGR